MGLNFQGNFSEPHKLVQIYEYILHCLLGNWVTPFCAFVFRLSFVCINLVFAVGIGVGIIVERHVFYA